MSLFHDQFMLSLITLKKKPENKMKKSKNKQEKTIINLTFMIKKDKYKSEKKQNEKN